jgi:glucan 1,3-beta-glucosidase
MRILCTLITLALYFLMLTGCRSSKGPNQPNGPALPRVHVEGQKVVDPHGREVILRGVNLGNWLLVEPGAFGGAIGKFPDQVTLFNKLHERFGSEEAERLIALYRENFMTERDIAQIKRFGFNFLRVGFDYSIFEDDARPMQLKADAFRYTDRALAWAKAHGMYVLFDLHGAPERQVDGKQSGQVRYNKFWGDPKAQERSLWLWKQIAERYRGETNVFGYEALNEPWGKSKEALRDYCARWYDVVRPIDRDAVLVFPGWLNGVEFYGRPSASGWTNMMFDMHFYPGQFRWGEPGPATSVQFLKKGLFDWRRRLDQLGAMMMVGEMKVVYSQPGSAEMTRRFFDFFAKQGWPVTLWTWKELRPKAVSPTGNWMLATNAEDLPPLDYRTSSAEELETFFRSLSTMPLRIDEQLLHWSTTTESPSPLP